MKTCKRCQRPLDESAFYRQPNNSDGLAGKCKACAIVENLANQRAKRDQYRSYEALRFQQPSRKAKKRHYDKTHQERYPERARARKAIANAVRRGRIKRQPCEVCADTRAQAHHDDYSKPFSVVWLCFKHHRERHGQKVGA